MGFRRLLLLILTLFASNGALAAAADPPLELPADPACAEATAYLAHAREEVAGSIQEYMQCVSSAEDLCTEVFARLEVNQNLYEDAVNQFINNC